MHSLMDVGEYEAVRHKVGWFRLETECVFEISGKDAVPFLQGMVTNDVKGLKEGTGCYAACLTNVGRMISDLRIFAFPNRLLVFLGKKEKGKILEYLDKFIFIEELSLKDLEGETALLSIQGPASRDLLEKMVGEGAGLKRYHHRTYQTGGLLLGAFGATHTGEEGFDFLVSREGASRFIPFLEEKGKSFCLREVSDDAREVLRIEAGIPRFGIDMDESTIPLEAGLENAISDTKGCYVGQEVIAKIKHLGHVNRKLVGLILSGPGEGGDAVFSKDREVGRITSSCYSPRRSSPVALAMLRQEAAKPGLSLTVKRGASFLKAELCPLPFYAPS